MVGSHCLTEAQEGMDDRKGRNVEKEGVGVGVPGEGKDNKEKKIIRIPTNLILTSQERKREMTETW